MNFEELTDYLNTLPGHRIEVHSWPEVPEAGAHLAGVVSSVETLPGPASEPTAYRYFCRIGAEVSNGFYVSPLAFKEALVGTLDPETDGRFIVFEFQGWVHQIVIDDPRIKYESESNEFVLPTA